MGIGLRALGDPMRSDEVLSEAIRDAREAGDRRIELRARLEQEYVRLPSTPGATASALLAVAGEGIPVFEATDDDRSLGRAWLLTGFVRGARQGQHKARERAAEQALVHYRRSHWPTSTCLGEIANAIYHGPTPVSDAIRRCVELLQDEPLDRAGRANVEVFLGGLVAQRGDFEEARGLVASAKTTYQALGQMTAARVADAMLGEVEALAGNLIAATETLSDVCAELERLHAFSQLASVAGDLSAVLYAQDRLDEASKWAGVAEMHSAADDLDARALWMPVRAKLNARLGSFDDAEVIIEQAIALTDRSDALNRRARASRDLGEILRLGGRLEHATVALDRATVLFERKGNVVGAAEVRSLRDEATVVR
jgi:tetratricopeptide (TPR) repeat protein